MAYALDYRGRNDDELAFVFVSPLPNPIAKAFDLLCRGGIFGRCTVYYEHACVYRHKKAYWRLVFMPKHYDTQLLSLGELRLLIEKMISKEGHTIRYYKDIDKLFNI